MKRLLPLLVLCLLLVPLTAQACIRVVVRPDSDYVKVFAKPNTDFFVKDDIDLGGLKGKDWQWQNPGGCCGSLSNGRVVGNNTRARAGNYEIFKRGCVCYRAYTAEGAKNSATPSIIKEYHNCLAVEGTWDNKKSGVNWTGLLNGSREDVMLAVKKLCHTSCRRSRSLFANLQCFWI